MSAKTIYRFPRLPVGTTLVTAPIRKQHLTATQKFEQRIAKGDIPRGYDRVNKRQRKLAKLIASGLPIYEACHRLGFRTEIFYRWRRANKKFREYLNLQIVRSLHDVEPRLERQVIRAVQVVDENLDSEDPYLAAALAKDVLKGRGRWKSSAVTKQTIEGHIDSTVKVDDGGMNRELMQTLVNAMVAMASGNKRELKVIDVEVEPLAQKALPAGE